MSDPILNKILENWNEQKNAIRPSAVDNYLACPRQWALVHIGGQNSIPNARAAIGTAIHAGVEQGWKESMAVKEKSFNVSATADCAIAELEELDMEGLSYDRGEDLNTAVVEVRSGIRTFISDIVPYTDIPKAVEQRFTVELEHPVFSGLSGTVDYLSNDTIADLKTSKRKPVPESYVTQQSLYKYLAEANGQAVKHSTIQGVVLKAKPEGHVLALTPNIERAKAAVNSLLDVSSIFHQQTVAPDILFRGNPKYYLCSDKYCAFHSSCPYVKGAAPVETPKVKM